MNDWNRQIIEEFRANGGRVEQFGDNPLVILHTIGAKSGEVREVPLVALLDGDDLIVFASKAGAPTHPDWLYNLRANPDIEVEFGTETFATRVTELSAEESSQRIQEQAQLLPQFADYVTSAAPRLIPALRIQRR